VQSAGLLLRARTLIPARRPVPVVNLASAALIALSSNAWATLARTASTLSTKPGAILAARSSPSERANPARSAAGEGQLSRVGNASGRATAALAEAHAVVTYDRQMHAVASALGSFEVLPPVLPTA